MRSNSTKTIAVRSITDRLKSEWGLKLVLLVVLNLWVYGPYLFLQRHNFFPATTMSQTFLDRLVPFWPWTVWVYLSIYLLMPVGPFLMDNRQQLFRYAMGIMLIGLIADAIFFFWPTSCPRPGETGTNSAYHILVSIDNSLHAFPSLHAAFAIYSAMCCTLVVGEMSNSRLLKGVFWIWAVLILLATLTTKQHVIADILAGSVLGIGTYCFVFYPWKSPLTTKVSAPTVRANLPQPNSKIP